MTNEPRLFQDEDPTAWINKYTEPIQSKQERLAKMARRADPETSWIAARAALPQLTKTKAKIVEQLHGHPGGLTPWELSQLLDMDKSSASKRLGDLRDEGICYTDGTRPSDRNRPSLVYKLKEIK